MNIPTRLLKFSSSSNFVFLLLCIAILAPGNFSAQSSISRYLKSDFHKGPDSLQELFQQQFGQMDFNKPLFRQLEFRTETNEFNLNQQEYTFRLSFQNLFDNKYSSKIYTLEKKIAEKKYAIWKAKVLAQKYSDLIDCYQIHELLDSYQSTIRQYKIMYNTYAIRLPEKSELIKTLAKIEIKLIEYQNEIIKLELDSSDVYNLMRLDKTFLTDAPLDIHPTALLSFLTQDQTLVHAETEVAQWQVEIEHNEYRQRKAAGNQILDFIQTRYASDPEDPVKEKASVGLGLKIPYIIRNNYLNENYQFNRMKLLWESEQKQQIWLQELVVRKTELINKCKQFIALEEKIDQLESKYALPKLMEEVIFEPEDVMDIRLEINMLNIHKIKFKFEILEEYIQYLHHSGHLLTNPEYYYLTMPFKNL